MKGKWLRLAIKEDGRRGVLRKFSDLNVLVRYLIGSSVCKYTGFFQFSSRSAMNGLLFHLRGMNRLSGGGVSVEVSYQ